MFMRFVLSVLVLSSFLVVGCTLSDDERCPDGYSYYPEIKACCDENDVFNETDKICEPPADTEPVDTSVETPSGLGDECTEQSACEGNEASYCAVNPLEGTGYCTTNECAPGDCTAGYSCCDCTTSPVLPKENACLTTADADLAASMGGCTCS